MAQGLPTHPPTGAGPRPWLGAAVFAAAALYLYPFWARVGLDADEAKIILGSLRILQGERLYVDFFEFIPPGLYAIVAGVLRAGGPTPDIYPLRLVTVGFGALGVLGTWAVAARASGRPFGALVPAALALAFGISQWCMMSIHWVSTAFALLATYTLLEVGQVRAPWRPWFLTGLGTGAVLLVAQHKGTAFGGAAAVLAVVYVVHAIRHLDRPATRMLGPEDALAAGVILVLAPMCVSLAVRGQFVPMLQATLGWTREGYSVANRVPYGYLAGTLFSGARWVATGAVVGGGFGWVCRVFVVYGGPLCCAGVFARGALRWRAQPTPAAWTDLTVGVVGLGMWATALTRPDILHLLTVAPWGFVAAMLLVCPAPDASPDRRRQLAVRIAAGVAVVLAVAWGASDHVELRRWKSLRLGGLGFIRYPHALVQHASLADSDIGQAVAFLQTVTVPGEPIFVYPYAPYFYYLADRPNPTRYNICFPGYQGEDAIREVIEVLESQAIPYVVLDPMAAPSNLRHAFPRYDPALFTESPLTQYIMSRYREAGRFGEIRILQRGVRAAP